MIGLVFGFEKNVCGYILIYTDSQDFFLVGLPMDCRGWGGGVWGWGLHHGPVLLSKLCPVPQKHYYMGN